MATKAYMSPTAKITSTSSTDPQGHGALMINHGIIVTWSCSIFAAVKITYKLSSYDTKIRVNVANLSCFVMLTFWLKKLFTFFTYILSLYIIYDWITSMGYSKHEFSMIEINMLYSLKKIVPFIPLPPHITATSLQRPLSSVTKVATVERFDCINIAWFMT